MLYQMMIDSDALVPIGYIHKQHGVQGELSVLFTVDLQTFESNFVIIEIEGIFVPFFIQNSIFRKDRSALFTFERIATPDASKELVGKTIYLPKELAQIYSIQPDPFSNQIIGYKITDKTYGEIGIIEGIDDSTENILFIVSHQNTEVLIPAVDAFITNIDDENKEIFVQLPDGLLEVNEKDTSAE